MPVKIKAVCAGG